MTSRDPIAEPVHNFRPQGRKMFAEPADKWNFMKNEHLEKFEKVEASKAVRQRSHTARGDMINVCTSVE